jgi:ABC-type phosphate transport system substrate-binding protein
MRRGRISLGVGLAVVGIGASALSVGASGGGGPIAQSITGSGSDTTQTMMAYLDYGYNIDAGYGDMTAGGCQQLATSPTPQWLDFSCADDSHGNITRTVTDGVTTTGSPNISSATAAFNALSDQGRGVEGTGIPAGAYIQSVTSATAAVLNVNATATATGVTFNFTRILTDNYRHDDVHGRFFLGSSNGVAQICAATPGVDYARSSRAPKSTDCSGLHFVAYALDGISWEAWNIAGSGVNNGGAGQNNLSAPCAMHTICLTQSQLKAIYISCTITNWNQVGGANVPISIYTPQAGSGTRSTFETFLGGSSTTCIPVPLQPSHQIPENSNGGIPASDQKGAIFPFSFGVWSTTVNGAGGTVLGNIDGVVTNRANIQSGAFPWDRSLYNVFNPATAQSGVADYVGEHGWICKNLNEHAISASGANFRYVVQSKISAAGFVPLPLGPIGGGDPGSDYCRLTVTP